MSAVVRSIEDARRLRAERAIKTKDGSDQRPKSRAPWKEELHKTFEKIWARHGIVQPAKEAPANIPPKAAMDADSPMAQIIAMSRAIRQACEDDDPEFARRFYGGLLSDQSQDAPGAA